MSLASPLPDSQEPEPQSKRPTAPIEAEAFAELAFDEEPESGAPEPRPADAPEPQPRRRFRRRLVTRLLFLLLGSILLPLTVEGLWFYYRTYQETLLLNLQREEVVLGFAFTDLNEWLVQRRARIEVALQTRDVQDALQTLQNASPESRRFVNARTILFHRLTERTRTEGGVPLYADFVFVGPDQYVLAATERTWEKQPLTELPFGPGLLASWSMAVEQPVHWIYENSEEGSQLGLGSAYPIRDANGELQGVLVGLSTDMMLRATLRNLRRWLPQGSAALVTANGAAFVWNPARQTLEPASADDPLGQTLRQAADVLAAQPSGVTLLEPYGGLRAIAARFGMGAVKRLVPYEHMSQTALFPLWWLDAPGIIGLVGWVEPLRLGVAISLPEAEAVAGVFHLLRLRLWVWGALILSTVGVAVVFGRDLLRRTQDLVQVAEAFAQGQWDVRAEVVGNDEMALLAYTFNDLADQLQATYATMERELNLRTQQVQLVVTMATVALEGGASSEQVLRTILERMHERFPSFAYLSLRLWLGSEVSWQLATRLSKLPQAVNLALRSFETHLSDEVRKSMDMQTWLNQSGQSLRLPPPLNWMIGLPLMTPQHFLGVLFVGGTEAEPPGEYDRFALRLLARQMTLVLEFLYLARGQNLEAEKHHILRGILERLPTLTHPTRVIPALVDVLTATRAQGVLLTPLPQLTDAWGIAYPQVAAKSENQPVTMRNLLSLISDGPAHIAVEEGETVGLGTLARLYQWQVLGLYPIRNPDGKVLAIWVRGARPGEGEMPLDREREQLFTELLGWVFVYADMQQRLSVWEVVQRILEYAPEAPSEGHLYLRAWELLQNYLPEADFFVASYRGGNLAYTFVYPYGQRYYHTTVTPLEQALIQQVLERGQPLLLSDKHKIITQVGRAVRGSARIPESWLGVPVRLGQLRLGVIGLIQRDRAHAFGHEQQGYLTTLAQGLAGVMYAVQQEGRLRQRITREQSLRTFAQLLTGLTDVRNMLELSAKEIQRLFEAKLVEIELFANPIETPTPSEKGEEHRS